MNSIRITDSEIGVDAVWSSDTRAFSRVPINASCAEIAAQTTRPGAARARVPAGQLRSADDLSRGSVARLQRIATSRLTRNANVMVSWRGAELRVHEGYLSAPPEIHEAIVAFVESRSRAERRAATKRIVAFAGSTWRDSGRRERMRPEDEPLARKLEECHARLNAEYFGGTLRAVPIRVSRRMKSRLGHYTAGGRRRAVDRWTGGPVDRDGKLRRGLGRSRSVGVTFVGTGGRRSSTPSSTRWFTSGKMRPGCRSTTGRGSGRKRATSASTRPQSGP